MAEIKKPSSLSVVWASQGDKVRPTDEKMAIGWLVEIPHREHFNFLENRRDSAIAHINQHGVAVWDATTEYIKDKSYVQGSDGVIYKCIFTNRGNDPTIVRDYWEKAFLSPSDPTSMQSVIGYTTSSGDINALPNRKYYLTNPASVTLPNNGSRGDAIVINKSPNITVKVSTVNGTTIFTRMGMYEEIDFDIYDEVNFVFNGLNWEVQ